MGTAKTQGQVWDVRARDWAELQEIQFDNVFNAVLGMIEIKPGQSVLDIGCASGRFCELAAQRGASVSGLDASEKLVAIARERTPAGDFRAGEMEELPYADQAFDVVTGFNAFQFAADPVHALREAARVAKKNGLMVASNFSNTANLQAYAFFQALGRLSPAPPPGAPGPFALSADGALEAAAQKAGLRAVEIHEVDCPWSYADEQTMLRALLSPAPAVVAVRTSGEEAVREAILAAMSPYKTAAGGYYLHNPNRFLVARV